MAKTLHQLLAGVHIASAAESLSLASLCGLDLDKFYELLVNGAAGYSWIFGDRGKRMVDSIEGRDVETKSKVSIFIKDLGIVVQEARSAAGEANVCTVPLAAAALELFENAVALGLSDEDDSSLWKVYSSLSDNRSLEASDRVVFNDKTVVDLDLEPFHKVKLCNQYTRAILVSFDEGAWTLPHTHSKDSVYLFLTPNGGATVQNHVRGQKPVKDHMEFCEVRFGTHCSCALTHRIFAEYGGGGVFCVDAEVLGPPPLVRVDGQIVTTEVESLVQHDLVKLRDKVRVFRLVLLPGESITVDYLFFHLIVVTHTCLVRSSDKGLGVEVDELKAVGDISWHGPVRDRVVTNIGDGVYGYFVVQWRNFSE
jgi:hypothetical protein